ncbi:MAG: GTP pyrophosphokinase [Fibrobacteria bacterium]|nr:GTP pyrophosphokinase [Fibrobacteria bacterium]
MELKQFLIKTKLSKKEFISAGISLEELMEIENDYKSRISFFNTIAVRLSSQLMKAKKVHSVKYRIKKPERLIEKIIRKRIDSTGPKINLANYLLKVKDLIGIRALHLFKEDWESLNDFICTTFPVYIKPLAYIRVGDPQAVISRYKKKGCIVKLHPHGYRSVHYRMKMVQERQPVLVELQIRTLFEEGWSEIDHLLRYCDHDANPFISPYLEQFNKTVGYADEMGSYILLLKKMTRMVQEKQEKSKETIKKLKEEINMLKISEAKKKALQDQILEISVGDSL